MIHICEAQRAKNGCVRGTQGKGSSNILTDVVKKVGKWEVKPKLPKASRFMYLRRQSCFDEADCVRGVSRQNPQEEIIENDREFPRSRRFRSRAWQQLSFGRQVPTNWYMYKEFEVEFIHRDPIPNLPIQDHCYDNYVVDRHNYEKLCQQTIEANKWSQLNGTHGESTDEDDVDVTPSQACKNFRDKVSKKLGNDDRKRANKAAAGQRLFARKSSNRGIDNFENPRVSETMDEEKADEPSVPTFGPFGHVWDNGPLYILRDNVAKVFFDGETFVSYESRSLEQIFDHKDKWYVVLPDAPFKMTVVTNKYNMYKCTEDGKGSNTVLDNLFTEVDFSKDLKINPRGIVGLHIYRPLLNELRKSFPNANPEVEHSVKACRAYVLRCEAAQHNMPMQMLTNTVEAYLYSQELLNRHYTNSKLLGQSQPAHLDHLEKSLIARLHVTAQYNLPYKMEGVSCTIADDYINRDDYIINQRKSRGFYNVDALSNVVDPATFEGEKYFRFDTATNDQVKYYRTAMCQIMASGDDAAEFMLYDINGINATKALKRMFGTYANNDVYRYFQYNLSDVLTGSPTIAKVGSYVTDSFTKRLLSTMRVEVTEEYYTVGNRDHSHQVETFEETSREFFHKVCCTVGNGIPTRWEGIYEKVRVNVSEMYNRLKGRCTRTVLDSIVDTTYGAGNWLYWSVHDKYLTFLDLFDSRYACTELPHIKRKLRRTFFKGVAIHDDLDVLVTKLDAIVKKEFAKLGKVPRLFVSYGAGGIYASELPEFVKMCIHGEYRLYGSRVNTTIYIMSKARSGELDEVFRTAHRIGHTARECIIVIYSDDSLMVGNIDDEIVMKNLDISSCDSSNRFPIFQAVAGLIAGFSEDRAIGLVRQCCLPMELRNASNPAESIAFSFDGPFEGSGTLLTTICNHTASALIATAIHTVINATDYSINECLRIGAMMVGHKLTVQECDRFEKLQFLKRSPLMCTTSQGPDWYACLNYGTIFRGFGTLEGDIAAEMLGVSNSELQRLTWPERMDKFLSVVVMGLKTEPSSRLMQALEQRFVDTPTIITDMVEAIANQHYMNVEQSLHKERPVICEDSLLNRYSMEAYELTHLCEQISLLRIGMCCSSTACAKFYAQDY